MLVSGKIDENFGIFLLIAVPTAALLKYLYDGLQCVSGVYIKL